MILKLCSNGATVLEEPENFSRFHCEIDPAFGALEMVRAALAPVAEIESRELAWVDRDALFSLGSALASDPAAWADRTQAMLDKAARYGWVRTQQPSIKSHIVWREAVPADSPHPSHQP